MVRVFLKIYNDALSSELQSYEVPANAVTIITQAAQEDGIPAINWMKQKIQDAAGFRGAQPKTLQEFFEEKTPIVISSEAVHGGTRPLILKVVDNLDREVWKKITYQYAAHSPAWAETKRIEYSLIQF